MRTITITDVLEQLKTLKEMHFREQELSLSFFDLMTAAVKSGAVNVATGIAYNHEDLEKARLRLEKARIDYYQTALAIDSLNREVSQR